MNSSRINSRNASVFWESERIFDYIYTFMKRRQVVEGDSDAELLKWIEHFMREKQEASLAYWYEIHKGIHESLCEF